MKAKRFKQRVAGTALTILVLTGTGLPSNAQDQTRSDPPPPPPDNSTVTGSLPPNIPPASPLGQVVRLTQAGVDQSIILTYATNSSGTFNLDSDKIIYLRDLGLPNEIITAMMQRDQVLQQQMTATTYPPPAEPPGPPPDTNTTPPEPADQPPPPAEVTTTYFYDTLAPYGSWIYVNGYGRCWRPSVCVYNPGWQPYCDHGHWVYTDCGWYWFSDYSWGWAPFHYGRWFQPPGMGWCWTPDTVWGPSWVTWRYSNGYCGWAPLPPFATYRAGAGFFYRGTSVSFGFNWGLDPRCFTFVPAEFFCDPHPRRHCVPPGQLTLVFNQTTSVNRFDGDGRHLANRGIDPEHISTFTHAPIRPVTIREITASPGHGAHGEQLSHDGGTLLVSHPAQPGSSGQNHPRPPTDNRPTHSAQPGRPTQIPAVTTHGSQDGNGGIRIVPQNPSTPANHNPSPTPVPVEPSHANRNYSPPRSQQTHSPPPVWPDAFHPQTPAVIPTPSQGQSGSSGTSHHNAPAAAPAPQQPSPGPSSATPRSSNQNNQNQGNSGNGSGYNNPGSGARH